jgi:Arc/MetJ-type ribon-helix-helix transcriptional regulator
MNNENFTEKVSVNINTSTLSGIDLLVDNGYYSNRSDFINQALREALQKHQNTLDRIIDAKMKTKGENHNQWFIGVSGLEKQEIESALADGQKRTVKGYGVLVIGDDVDEETLFEVVETIQVKGKVVCRKSIKEHYGLK